MANNLPGDRRSEERSAIIVAKVTKGISKKHKKLMKGFNL